MQEPMWVNYHKHTSLSNVYTKDSPLIHKDYWDELKRRYGSQECIYTTVEHGWAGNYFKTYDDLEKYNTKNNTNIRFIFGAEAYWVKNRHEEDKSNCHIILLARNDNGRKAINKIISIANKDGYYYRPRIDIELLNMLPGEDVMITTACIAFWNKYEDIDEIVKYLADRFKYFYLEVQSHNTESQKKLNKHIIHMHNELNIPIIAGVDSHVISENQMADRDDLLESAHISYEDEDGWYMDYPTYDILFKRFQEQGILKNEEIREAINNTNAIFQFEEIKLDRSLKVPVIKSLRGKTQEERNKIQKYLDSLSTTQKQKYEEKNYSQEFLEKIFGNTITVEDYLKQTRKIQRNELIENIVRTEYNYLVVIGDMFDGIYDGKFKDKKMKDMFGLTYLRYGFGHGEKYYSGNTDLVFEEMIATYSEIMKSRNPEEGLKMMRYFLGDELIKMISDYYNQNLCYNYSYVEQEHKTL